MRVLIFHGYLLRGTGSNVYNAELAQAFVRAGHEVHLLCQDRDPLGLPWVDAVGDWDGGGLDVRVRADPARATVYRPDIGGLLPVYVADRYDGVEARPFPELSDEEVEGYLERNVAAVRDVMARAEPDVALANHLVMGPAVLARALAGTGVPYAVKIHGSALEYVVKPHPRFLPYAREGLDGAGGVLVGSRHTAESLWEAIGDADLPARTRLGPPGVDVERFAPREGDERWARLDALRRRLEEETHQDEAEALHSGAERGQTPSVTPRAERGQTPSGGPDVKRGLTPGDAFARSTGEAAAGLAAVRPGERLVVFVGKLIASKGVELLLAAWPLVRARVGDARLVVIGFGAFREGLEALAGALARGDLDAARATRGESGGELPWLAAFLDGLAGDERAAYADAARAAAGSVAWTGRLDHDELADVLPAAEAMAVPSTFPEAFGMVAAEAAACGALPVVARHSGLAEVAETMAGAVPAPARPWLTFEVGPGAVGELAAALAAWLQAPAELRAATRDAMVAITRERYSWDGVARTVIAAARGQLDDLACVPATG
jgi:glycosyltransferase involved in cell wall biosynthesis